MHRVYYTDGKIRKSQLKKLAKTEPRYKKDTIAGIAFILIGVLVSILWLVIVIPCNPVMPNFFVCSGSLLLGIAIGVNILIKRQYNCAGMHVMKDLKAIEVTDDSIKFLIHTFENFKAAHGEINEKNPNSLSIISYNYEDIIKIEFDNETGLLELTGKYDLNCFTNYEKRVPNLEFNGLRTYDDTLIEIFIPIKEQEELVNLIKNSLN